MKKISVSNIIIFIRKSQKGRITFIANLKKPKIKKEDDEGGHYWICSSSTVSKVFKSEQLQELDDKIEILSEKRRNTVSNVSKGMYQKNIDILHNAKDIDYAELKPYYNLNYLKNTRLVLELHSVPVQVSPNHVFTFMENHVEKVGAIWFVAKKEGYSKRELAVFVYSLNEYLKKVHGAKYEISLNYCIVFDITIADKLTYKQMIDLGYKTYTNDVLTVLKKAIA